MRKSIIIITKIAGIFVYSIDSTSNCGKLSSYKILPLSLVSQNNIIIYSIIFYNTSLFLSMTLDEIKLLSNSEYYDFIIKYRGTNPNELALKLSKDKTLPARAITEQVFCHQKAKKKLPTLSSKNLLFDKVALEQASSEATAKYKASLIVGANIIDLTGGLGIDEIFFATSFNRITYCELNKVVSEIFSYNITKLNISNISVNNTDSIKYLERRKNDSFNWIYIDPSRRDEKRRSVDLEFCTPNVYDNMNLFFEKSKNVMIKVAPAFDLTEAVKRFPNLTEIHVISVDGECKEVLLLLNRESKNIIPKVFAIKLNFKDDNFFTLTESFNNEKNAIPTKVSSYFYEPDCSIIKANLTSLLSEKLELSFINKLTPFLTSNKFIKSFPGRSFKVVTSFNFNEKELKKYLRQNKITKGNITRRDFRMSVAEIRKRFKLKDGGDIYLFFTTNLDEKKIVVICQKNY